MIVLRGVNLAAAAKTRPGLLYVPTDAELRRLREDLGASAIRLLVFWEAIEPSPGKYDHDYLLAVRDVVERAGAADLRVVVDVHQDVFGRGFGFSGAPRWACDEAAYQSFVPPEPWFAAYLEPEVMDCFDAFWREPVLRDRYAGALAALARALHGTKGLFGYDLFNEPHWGYRSPDAFEREVASEAYRGWADAVQSADPSAWVFLEPVPARSFGGETTLRPPASERATYAPHFYEASVELEQRWDGNERGLGRRLRRMVVDAERLGVPAVLGEVGGRGSVRDIEGYTGALYRSLDRAMLGAFHYEGGRGARHSYALFDERGAPYASAAIVARPHPERTAGVPIEWSWDAEQRIFRFTWEEDPSVGGVTRVTLPRLSLGSDWAAYVDPPGPMRAEGAALAVEPVRAGRRQLVIRGGA